MIDEALPTTDHRLRPSRPVTSDHRPTDPPLRPVGGGGRTFLGVRRMGPQDDGGHLFDDDGADVATVGYGERVYINGRVMSFREPKPGEPPPSR